MTSRSRCDLIVLGGTFVLRRFNIADHSDEAIQLTATIVSAYVSNNIVPSAEIPALISEVYSALMRVTNGTVAPTAVPLKPAVPIKHSVTADQVGPAARLSYGSVELQSGAVADRQADGTRPATKGAVIAM